jgi:hypothetical protein
MKDPVGCTCAVQNGGGVTHRQGGGERWFSKRDGRAPTNEAFVKCQIRALRREIVIAAISSPHGAKRNAGKVSTIELRRISLRSTHPARLLTRGFAS